MKLKTKRKTLLNEKQLKAIQTYSVIHSKTLLEDGKYLVEYTRYNMDSYNDIVNSLVKEKYSDSEEFALINKGIEDNTHTEYVVYRKYVEECKKIARTFIDERTSVIGR